MSENRDDLGAVVLALSMRLRALEARLADGGPDPKPALDRPGGPARFQVAAIAFEEAGFSFSDWTVQRKCRRHAGVGGWAILLDRRWHVRQPGFDRFVDQVRRGLEKF